MQCKYCGKELEQIPGKKAKEYCNGSHRQMAFKKRKKVEMPVQGEAPGGELLEELRKQNTALHTYIRDKDVEIDDQAATIARLRLQLDVERRFLEDNERRGFKAYLKKKKPATPLISRLLADPLFAGMDTRKHYQYQLQFYFRCSDEELQEFIDLWKLMLLEAPH